MSLPELRKRENELIEQMRDLMKRAQADKRDLSEEEEERYNSLESEFDRTQKMITRQERLEERERELDRETTAPAYGGSTELNEKEERSSSGRIIKPNQNEKRGQFDSLGDFLRAVAIADGTRGQRVDPRLVYTTFEQRAPSGFNESIPQDGGWLVDKEMFGGLLERAFQMSNLAARAQRLPIGANKNGMTFQRLKDDSRATGSRFGGVRAYWLGEGERKIASRFQFEPMEMKLKKLAALCYATDELLEDSVALEGLINRTFPKEFAFTIDESILWGTGVGQPLGVFNSGAVVTVAPQGAQTARTIVYENILNMISVFHEEPGSQPIWIANRNTLPQLATMALMMGGSGVPVWMPADGRQERALPTLFGYPVVWSEHAATLGETGDLSLVDLNQYLIIEKGGLKADVSGHVRFEYDEQVFRFVYRIDGQTTVNKPVTPYRGAAGEKHSPFVTLGPRTV